MYGVKELIPSLNPFVIGTSGHIDHGKSTLVKALTGVNTDKTHDQPARIVRHPLYHFSQYQAQAPRLNLDKDIHGCQYP